MLVEVFFGTVGLVPRLFQEDELSLKVTLMLVVNNRPLQRKPYIVHKRFSIGIEILVRVVLRKLLLRLLYPLLFLL